jgi:hypothetical protein
VGKVKGKQVKLLHDLVTVIAEHYTFHRNFSAKSLSDREGLYNALMHKSGNLPFVGTRPKGQVTRY